MLTAISKLFDIYDAIPDIEEKLKPTIFNKPEDPPLEIHEQEDELFNFEFGMECTREIVCMT